jgi:nitroimidazol reductase NimA-like FMN-containing flavoprotein (pyridoxamine 5'-phosphate oxidase superfamily)
MSDESWRGRVGRLDEAEISTFLAEAHLARLACLDDEGWPHVVPCHTWCPVGSSGMVARSG